MLNYFMLNQQLLHSMSLERIISNNASKTSGRKQKITNQPTSLTNCIAKIRETVFKNLILGHCEATNVFGPQQSAYRANRCILIISL